MKNKYATAIIKQMVADGCITQEVAEKYCLELAESKDEKIRKAIRTIILSSDTKQCQIVGVSQSDMFTWLEKQGEHKKFRDRIQVGDKVTRNEDGMLVNLSQLNRVAKKDEKQGEQKLTPIFRIGDTLIAKDGTCIEKEPFHIDKIEDDCYWDGENTILVCNQDEFEIFEQKPANKVAPKFKVGDTVKDPYGDLYHITEIIDDSYKTDDGRFILFENQEVYTLSNFTAWSEEDEKIISMLITDLNLAHDVVRKGVADKEREKEISFLKSLKDRIIPQPKQEWSEEDVKTMRQIFRIVGDSSCSNRCYNRITKFLNKIAPLS